MLEKYKVEAIKRGAYKGRGEPLKVENGSKSQNIATSQSGVKIAGRESSYVSQGI